ncbi:MAG: FHA domain-containing protein, partial [Polyangiaceae bacterium]|nr:FHA domain-containing protein [Polyangiaceae bacterium]
MPTLKHFAEQGAPGLFSVHKPVTTIGRALGNDVSLKATGVAEHHAQIVFDGRDFVLEEIDRVADIAINGKKKRRARLVHGDRLQLGAAELGFSMFAEVQAAKKDDDDDDAPAGGPGAEIAGVRKLFSFSEKLINRKSVDEILEAMLDDVIELTHAQKGFLLLVEGAEAVLAPAAGEKDSTTKKLVVRASRNVRHESITDTEGMISDSIVRRVIDSGRP